MEKSDHYNHRLFLFPLLAACFFALWIRSADLMLIRGSFFYRWAENNRLRRLSTLAPRGRIMDINGNILADNIAVYEGSDGKIIERDQALLEKGQGKEIKTVLQRRYWLGEKAGHLTGYLGQAAGEEIGQLRCGEGGVKYETDSLVGRGGLEEYYDCLLLGKNGERLVEVDTGGEIVREIAKIDAVSGRDLVVTLDLGLQEEIHNDLIGLKAAAVVLDIRSGAILAMVSAPSFDPNLFNWQRDEIMINRYLSDREGTPLLNRAIGGAYHPGSIFKPIVAIAGLEEKKITPETLIEDTGKIKIGDWEYNNWYWTEYGRKEGMVNLIKAIKRSNDIYFYKAGEMIGAEIIAAWAEKFNLGKVTGIDLPGETSGIVPSPAWKQEVKGEPWFLGNTYHLAIGQGDLTVTPLQMVAAIATVATGNWCRPRLDYNQEPVCHNLGLQDQNLAKVREGMVEACAPGGTGYSFFNYRIPVGCKTGTAEVGDGTNVSHAWFTLFAPASNPEISLVVFVERGGSGADIAGPIAKKIIDYWFNPRALQGKRAVNILK